VWVVFIKNGGLFMNTNKHLTHDNRSIISNMLDKRCSFNEIATKINKDPTTISKEVRKRRVIEGGNVRFKPKNDCLNRRNCKISKLCIGCTKSRCSMCSTCNKVCKDYIQDKCNKLLKAPYVCNGCSNRYICQLKKFVYKADDAQKQYKITLSESRQGFNVNQQEVDIINKILTPLVKNNQSLYHIFTSNKDKIMLSERTLYRLVNSNVLIVRNIDMPKKVKYRPRKKTKELKIDKSCTVGRKYEDYLKYIADGNDYPAVEMDTLEGKKGGPVLLTLFFTSCNLQLAFKREANTAQSVVDIFDYLYEILGHDNFVILFRIIVTDNGSEFSNPRAIEFNSKGERRAKIFYCNPNTPGQKGACEKNHVEIRKILPKGTPLDDYSQDDINLAISHVNSYLRKKLNNKSPYSVFSSLYDKTVLDILSIQYIEPNSVILKPKLLSK
jgi:IS30 family transposase